MESDTPYRSDKSGGPALLRQGPRDEKLLSFRLFDVKPKEKLSVRLAFVILI